ncbi:fascin-3 [Ahaetulla prasina]|uniref:fascin-3 n=1 Tax=Ahaetulla prasina TaxID=499056 RepID=UPI002647A63D|nr:fascin-3 [Ahaetulla prasina]
MQIGLVNWTGGYLTCECYGDGVSVLGSSLGKKQTWKLRVTTEQGKQDVVALVGHQGQHLLVETDGTVRCGRPVAKKQSRFLLEVHPSGAWTLQQLESQKFLESDGEDVFCVARGLTAHHLWMPQLAEHVHVVLFNPSSQLYARTDPELNRVWVDAPVPYLEECGFLLRFKKGTCHLETSTHKFVSRAEKLATMPSTETAFHLNLKPGCLAFLTDMEGHVLYPQGSRGLLCLGDYPEEHEEWFVIKRCPLWVSLRTRANRFISIISDSEVYAGPKKLSPMSTFLFEMDSNTQTVQLKGVHHKYLAQRPFRCVLANGAAKEAETRFQVLWHHGRVFLRAPGGRYLGTLPVGLLVARATHPGPNEEFVLRFANRSFLVLRGYYGYVGSSPCRETLQGNLLEPEPVEILPCKHGVYHLQSRGKSFWSLTPERTFSPWGKFALNFYLEIQGNNLLAIIAPNGYYVRGDRDGCLVADSEEIARDCLWEF